MPTPATLRPEHLIDGDFLLVANRRIPRADVQMIIAEGGFNVTGGELVGWQRVVVVTPTARIPHNDTNPNNSIRFNAYLHACPQAVGLPYHGDLRMPACPADADPVTFLADVLHRVRAELSRQTKWALLSALLAVVVALASVALLVILFIINSVIPHILIAAAVASPVIAVAMLIRSLVLSFRRRKILRALRALSIR